MTTLHLGVLDFPYATNAGQSTGDVAEILEKKYHIMATFFAVHEVAIGAAIEQSVADALEDMMSGGPGVLQTAAAESAIESMFQIWISARGMDGTPGVPTKASLNGVSHRRKHPYAKRGPRPSFVDTGTYLAAFKAWTDGVFGGGGAGGFAAAAEDIAEDV